MQCLIRGMQWNAVSDKGNAVSDQGNAVSDQGKTVSHQGNTVSDQGNAVSDHCLHMGISIQNKVKKRKKKYTRHPLNETWTCPVCKDESTGHKKFKFSFRYLDCTGEIIKKKLSSCPEKVTKVAMSSWYETVEHTEMFCEPHIDPTPEPEPEMCVDINYSPDNVDCDVGDAVSCVIALKRQLFDPRGTEEKFCTYAFLLLTCFRCCLICEPEHDKTNKMTCTPSKTQISLRIRAV